jgi:protein SCO1/2
VKALAVALILVLVAHPGTASAHELSRDQLRGVTFEQKLGNRVPLDLAFRDQDGQPVTLRDFFDMRPVLLTLNYFHCNNLCPLELDGLMSGLNGLSFTPGNEFLVLTVSIDSRDGPAEASDARARALRGFDKRHAADGWRALTTDRQDTIDQLAQSVGFHYVYDPQEDEFAHPTGAVVLTSDGRVSRYLYGLDFSATDLRLALVDAAAGSIGTLLDRALLVCYHYDPLTGRYTPLALDLLRIGGGAGVLALAGLLGWLWVGERRMRSGGG